MFWELKVEIFLLAKVWHTHVGLVKVIFLLVTSDFYLVSGRDSRFLSIIVTDSEEAIEGFVFRPLTSGRSELG